MFIGVLCLIAAVLISLWYDSVVRRDYKGSDSLKTWRHTLVSVIVASFIAIFIFYLQSYITDYYNKKKYLALVQAELSLNFDNLRDTVRKTFIAGGVPVKAHMLDLRDVAVEDAVRSGLFSTKETMCLYFVLDGIRAIRWDRDAIQNLAITSAVTAENIQAQAGLIEEHKEKLITAINQAAKFLHISPLILGEVW